MPSRARRRARRTPSSSSERPGSASPACSTSSAGAWAIGRLARGTLPLLRTRHAVSSVDRSPQAALRDRRVGSGRRDHRPDRGRVLAPRRRICRPIIPYLRSLLRRGPGRPRRVADGPPAPPGGDRGGGRPTDRRRGAASVPRYPHRGSALDRQRLRGAARRPRGRRGRPARAPRLHLPDGYRHPFGERTLSRADRAGGPLRSGHRADRRGRAGHATAARGDRRDPGLARARGTRSTWRRSSDRSESAPFARRQTATWWQLASDTVVVPTRSRT